MNIYSPAYTIDFDGYTYEYYMAYYIENGNVTVQLWPGASYQYQTVAAQRDPSVTTVTQDNWMPAQSPGDPPMFSDTILLSGESISTYTLSDSSEADMLYDMGWGCPMNICQFTYSPGYKIKIDAEINVKLYYATDEISAKNNPPKEYNIKVPILIDEPDSSYKTYGGHDWTDTYPHINKPVPIGGGGGDTGISQLAVKGTKPSGLAINSNNIAGIAYNNVVIFKKGDSPAPGPVNKYIEVGDDLSSGSLDLSALQSITTFTELASLLGVSPSYGWSGTFNIFTTDEGRMYAEEMFVQDGSMLVYGISISLQGKNGSVSVASSTYIPSDYGGGGSYQDSCSIQSPIDLSKGYGKITSIEETGFANKIKLIRN